MSPVGWLWSATLSRLAVASQRLAVPSQGGIYACTNACMDGQTYVQIFSLSICWSVWIPLCLLLKKVHCLPTELPICRKLVKVLKDLGSFDKIHVVGHSLGAHVSGFLGKKVNLFQKWTQRDPKGPAD